MTHAPLPGLHLLVGGLGAGAGLGAALGFVHGGVTALTAGIGLHLLAVGAIALAAYWRGLAASERRLLATMAAGLPGVGGLLAMGHLVAGPGGAANAHAAHPGPAWQPAPAPRRLTEELGVTSCAELLREGSLEQKRNLLRRLAGLGEPRHLALVRRFLADAEPELRLCAYAELAAVAQRHESRIGALQRRVDAQAALDDLVALAEEQLAHAVSGALDAEMARYWLGRAEQAARRAVAEVPEALPAQRVLAAVLAASARVDEAWAIAMAWPEDGLAPEFELTRAQIAFRRRDRAPCERAVARLEAAGAAVPSWLRTVTGTEVSA